ncbi:MAG: hypothetical protein ACRDHU_14975 [Actinomycetota bacterium]
MTCRPRVNISAVVFSVTVLSALLAAPTSAAVLGRAGTTVGPRLTGVEARQYGRWWENQTRGEELALLDVPLAELQIAAEQAWAMGVTRAQLRAALFTNAAQTVFARNAAGGEGQPSPYLEYFTNNPVQLGGLGALLSGSPDYLVGPGGTQDQLFATFVGLRESYLASLGLQEVNGRIVDARFPYLTPYLAELLFGPPKPLPQPAIARNVAGVGLPSAT